MSASCPQQKFHSSSRFIPSLLLSNRVILNFVFGGKLGECVELWFVLTPPPLKWLTEQKHPFEVCKHAERYNEFGYKPLDDFIPSKTWMQISVCFWLEGVCGHPLNKDFSQFVIGTFYQCHFQKMAGWVAFNFFSLCWSLNRLNVSFYLIAILQCSGCENSFLTGKESPVECAHCRSPRQTKILYIFTRTFRKAL